MKSFFTTDELKCKCCGKVAMDTEFMNKLNAARWLSGFPFIVGSGYRCEKHNKAVGSTSTNHTSGMAADIRCMDSFQRYQFIKSMIGAGMLGIGIGKDFIHCDVNRTRPAIWTY